MINEQDARRHTCCFTGHRPEKLSQSEQEITALLETAISAAINDGFTTFITGMSRGVDLWAAEAVLRLRGEGQALRLLCASPFEGFEKSWPEEWRNRYRRVRDRSDEVNYICPSYSRSCFQRRNEWMVDRSARVIAVYTGGRGGTKNTVDYARARGIPVKLVTGNRKFASFLHNFVTKC